MEEKVMTTEEEKRLGEFLGEIGRTVKPRSLLLEEVLKKIESPEAVTNASTSRFKVKTSHFAGESLWARSWSSKKVRILVATVLPIFLIFLGWQVLSLRQAKLGQLSVDSLIQSLTAEVTGENSQTYTYEDNLSRSAGPAKDLEKTLLNDYVY